jgi:MFS transporter, DHA1 family, multidrug resistance protein
MALLLMSNFGFGLIAPNAVAGARQPLPQIAGAACAATGFVHDARCSVFALGWCLLLAGHQK